MTAPDQASPTGQDTPPTCYRHPGRETWVSCVRCGRHACPDCLRDAAVGQQCVDCVRGATGQGGQGARAARTVFGGRPSRSATVTWTLVAINVLVFLAEVARPSLLYDLGMISSPVSTPVGVQSGVAGGQWYRLITSAFTAPGTSIGGLGLLDIAFNLWALFVLGPELEQSARQDPVPGGLPAQRGRRIAHVLLSGADRAGRRRVRRDLRPVRRLVRGLPAAPPRQPGDRPADRHQPGIQLLLPQRDRLARPYRWADHRRAAHRSLCVRTSQEPGGVPGRPRPSCLWS